MGALLRVLTKDTVGTLSSQIFPIDHILHTTVTIREQDKDSIESMVGSDEKGSTAQYSEYSLRIKLADGSETEIDAVNNSCEFEVRDEEGEVVVKTESLVDLEDGLMTAHLKCE